MHKPDQSSNLINSARPLAAIYVRVSTQDQVQHGFSLDAQQDTLQNYAKAIGYDIFKIYRDEGKSAKDMNRPEMQQMLQDAKDKKFSAIFIYKLDRFSRSLKDLILTIDQLKEWGIDFVSLQDKIETASASGKLMFHIISAFAEFERNIIGDRTKFGMERKAKEGGFITRAPLGYKMFHKQLIIDPTAVDRVREIYRKFTDSDISLTQLAQLNGMTTSGIIKLLSNKTYLGKIKFGEHESEGTHLAIIEQAIFNKVQEKLAKMRSK